MGVFCTVAVKKQRLIGPSAGCSIKENRFRKQLVDILDEHYRFHINSAYACLLIFIHKPAGPIVFFSLNRQVPTLDLLVVDQTFRTAFIAHTSLVDNVPPIGYPECEAGVLLGR
jgi:hypothetical protein